ncbi:solute carrier family 23 protein [Isobaculum melis]|uniref:Uracil permease n=1 Tax=Isobaculum melis TaxID=142588 RepID=A0A1H9T1B6_9LACT|nr:solute carrier family 23 protein [Isobaculum melis]SER90794.1 uracil permease [Isobaculum melis]
MLEEERNTEVVLDIGDKPAPLQWFGLSLQHLCTMVGANVLVPILVGLNPGIALVTSGLGTLLYLALTKGKIPAYLGSSFAFITPMLLMKETAGGFPAVFQGAFYAGLVYWIVALIIKKAGSNWIDKVLPPIVVGPVVMVIGLSLAATAANQAMYIGAEAAPENYSVTYLLVALATLMITIICNMYLKGFMSLIPILIGIVSGYLIALAVGIVDLSAVGQASWFALPDFQVPFISYQPSFSIAALATMAPIAFVTMSEHIGHIMVLNKITNRNFFKKPGLSRTIFADGTATIIASLLGGPPATSYGENIGVLALTKIHSVFVIAGAASLAILFGFIGKVSAIILSIPWPVIAGVSFLLFGVIASSGLRILIDHQIDFNKKRNLIITSVILIIGIGGVYLNFGALSLSGMSLATVVGIILNLVLPKEARSEQA